MTDKDLKGQILEILVHNSRVPKKRIATMLAVPEEKVAGLMAEMEEEKTVLKYTTIANWEKVDGRQRVCALISVEAQPQRGVGFNAIAGRIAGFPEVTSLMLMSGSHDFTVMVEGETMLDISRFVSEKLAAIEGVRKTATNFVLKNYKVNDVILEDENGQ